MTEYSVQLGSRMDPLRYMFDKLVLTSRLMRWLVLLTEFDIEYVTQKSIKWSVLVDHLASLPVIDSRVIDDDFPDEEIVGVIGLSGWRMYFDGAPNHFGYGIGVILISSHGDHCKDQMMYYIRKFGQGSECGKYSKKLILKSKCTKKLK